MRWRWVWLCLGVWIHTATGAPLVAKKTTEMRQAVDDLTLAAANHDMVLIKVQPKIGRAHV